MHIATALFIKKSYIKKIYLKNDELYAFCLIYVDKAAKSVYNYFKR